LKYKGIIFDLDGVICSTDHLHYLAWKEIADDLGIYFDEEINNRLRGISRMESLGIILENYNGTLSEAEKEELAEQKNTTYRRLLLRLTEADLSESVKMTLKELRQRGLVLSIGSSSKNAVLILRQLGLADYFDAISDGNNISETKPAPEVFLKAADFMQLSPDECLVVEDAKMGIEAAVRGGFTSAGIGDAAGYEKATYGISDMKELLDIVDNAR